MKYKLLIFVTTLILVVIFIPYFLTPPVFAQSVGCVVTKVGNPLKDPPPLPPECNAVGGLPKGTICLPIENSIPVPGRYCKMPYFTPNASGQYNDQTLLDGAPDGSYKFLGRSNWNTSGPQIWGAEETLSVLYTVARWWKHGHKFQDGTESPPHPNGYLIVRDITSSYHTSSDDTHKSGIAADIRATTDGTDCVANFDVCSGDYNEFATVQLGKLLVDTGHLHIILHNATTKSVYDPTTKAYLGTVNNLIINYAVTQYPAKFRGLGSATVQWSPGHGDHFHVYIDRVNDYTKSVTDTSNTGVIDKSRLKDCKTVAGVGCGL